MRPWDPRLLPLFTFLTRHQAWYSLEEIGRLYRPGGERVSSRTIKRWFTWLRDHGGFVYYPYPRANRLGLQDVLVRARGVKNLDVFSLLPFASSFAVEIGLGDTEPFVSQGYWVPGTAMEDFRAYWRAACDLELLSRVELFPSRNTHYIYSPFERTILPGGLVELAGEVDNEPFRALIRAHMRERWEVRILGSLAESPLLIPIVVERIWSYYSSRQVWEEIRNTGETRILDYGRKKVAKMIERPGAAVQVLHRHWRQVLSRFDDVFLQPRIGLDWMALQKSVFVSAVLRAGSTEEAISAAIEASRLSVYTAFRPSLESEGLCHLSSLIPADRLVALVGVVRRHHRGLDPAFVAVQDREATIAEFRPAFCRLDWRLFDPVELRWGFDGDGYVRRLEQLRPAA